MVTVAGASMGALVGGLYSVGRLDDFAAWARTLTKRDVLSLLDIAVTGPGLFRADRVLDKVSELVQGARIENLPIPFTAVATDLESRRAVWFGEGPLDAAIRASISIPGVFMPIVLNGRLLADGGLTTPLPIAPTRATPSDATVAISLTGPAVRTLAGDERNRAEADHLGWTDRVRQKALHLSKHRPAWQEDALDVIGELPPGLHFMDIVNQSIDTMTDFVTRLTLAGYPVEASIEVPADACGVMDFHRADEIIDLGRELATAALDRAGL